MRRSITALLIAAAALTGGCIGATATQALANHGHRFAPTGLHKLMDPSGGGPILTVYTYCDEVNGATLYVYGMKATIAASDREDCRR